jgi:DNA-binding response OmpR family regulator
VLLVEDSSLVLDALRILLQEHGYAVSTADSIESARNAVAEHPPDIALLDITLPDGDGLELAREWVKEHSTVVIALTGHADEETRSRCLDAGCHDVLVKPVATAELISHLQAVQT